MLNSVLYIYICKFFVVGLYAGIFSEMFDCKDVCTDTDSDDHLSVGDSGITSLTSFPTADCQSPTSSVSKQTLISDGNYLV